MKKKTGKVYLVGAGPGDPELITRKGARLLAQAGCVLYDRLVNPQLLNLAPRWAERIYVGKQSDEKGRGQLRVSRLMVEKARRHSVVVRLKGGDPTLFGRVVEERNVLTAAGVPHEIVPGVSSAWAAAAAAGIALTDRRTSSSVAFVTGHRAAGRRPLIHWKELARGADTIVILMGRAVLSKIIRRLRRAGRPATTPVALIRWASMPQQEQLISTLKCVEADLRSRPLFGPPMIAIVGKVVGRPLQGRKILVTRPKADAAEITRRLEERGAVCLHLPTIQVRPRRLPGEQVKTILERLPKFDWILLNSHHGVEALNRWARQAGVPLKRVVRGKICAIGPRTETALRAAGLKSDLKPKESSVKGVKKSFEKIRLQGKKMLIPRSNLGIGDDLAQTLRRRGAQVEEIAAYETRPIQVSASKLRRAIHAAHAVTFTSASTAESFLEAIRRARLPLPKALNGTIAVAIGPSTAKVLRKAGVHRLVLPDKNWTLEGLVSAVEKAMGR